MAPENRLSFYKQSIVAIVGAHVEQCVIYLFGSRARGTNLEGADIDIALDAGVPITPLVISRIRSDIDDSALPIFVDVVDYNAVSEQMKSEIQRDAVVWKK